MLKWFLPVIASLLLDEVVLFKTVSQFQICKILDQWKYLWKIKWKIRDKEKGVKTGKRKKEKKKERDSEKEEMGEKRAEGIKVKERERGEREKDGGRERVEKLREANKMNIGAWNETLSERGKMHRKFRCYLPQLPPPLPHSH